MGGVKVCSTYGCWELVPCPKHPPKSWAGRNGTSSRRDRGITKSGWQEQAENRRVLKAHGGYCYLCGGPGCRQVDHVIPRMDGGPDTPENKRPVCDACHAAKSKAEAARARAFKPLGYADEFGI